ncbi:MAG: ATP-binding cassette domain-containing protein [Ancrocorticia sp.]|jgi:ABC-2 type transport system ATP-binding protein|nr:ATP-binding cassette domain-containing protein [Ancrocorticia sp.]MCI1896468.1 ATP-binding cassette domain-containing protein [Ancrocorticia sp.]MCI1933072.1 ATP-binding cassette domain-containing protein [Ancrocorticia sp.]MCI1963854.1 ATP-binding cassette domain-containing protein [Ancrocorticia sp.]MCI2002192.1 ATP-binding cassette domain-containing protein [Ancrocorticia sp.]
MLRIDSLNKTFGEIRALRDLSFHVNKGEIFGFVGSNGAGKTTAMRITLGVMTADSGAVTWDNMPMTFETRRSIGYMPEERGLYPRMPVGPQLEYLARLHGLEKDAAHSAMMYWTDRLGLAHRRSDNVQKLSLGNQQRVQLAAALVHDPFLMVLDEPFSGLDPVAVDVMSTVLRDKVTSGATVIFSSHQLDLVERLCDRVGIISQGRMVAEGTINELRTTDITRYTLAVSASLPAIAEALRPLGITVEPDPLAGTAEAPNRPGTTRVVFAQPNGADDQAVLRAALAAGSVHEFAPRRPHLADLFKDVVVTDPAPEEPQSPPRKGLFGTLARSSRKGHR